MQHASLFSERSVIRTADEAREKLRSALSILDDLTPSNHSYGQGAVTEQEIRSILKARRNRTEFFPADLFADPAWDMLLELYAAKLGQRRLSVSRLCTCAGVPQTTALRWLATLEQKGLAMRSPDPFDGRRFFIELSGQGTAAMDAYFSSSRGDAANI